MTWKKGQWWVVCYTWTTESKWEGDPKPGSMSSQSLMIIKVFFFPNVLYASTLGCHSVTYTLLLLNGLWYGLGRRKRKWHAEGCRKVKRKCCPHMLKIYQIPHIGLHIFYFSYHLIFITIVNHHHCYFHLSWEMRFKEVKYLIHSHRAIVWQGQIS